LTLTLPPEKTAGGKLGLSTTSESSGRAEMSLSGALTGYAGHAERVEFSLRQGVNSTSWLDLGENSLLLSVSVPEIFTRKSTSAMQVALERHHMPDSSLESLVKGGSVTWAHAGGRHALTASLAHRTLRACSAKMPAGGDDSAAGGAAPAWREPSPSILALASGGVGVGRSLKSSLKYSFAHTRLDCSASPTRGWSLGASGELAGLLGDAAFLRVDVDAKRYWQLPLLPRALGASIGVGALGQAVHNLSSRTPRVFVADRLFLGHSLTLRGHAPHAAGPRDGLDALGGELALAGAVHLGFNLPSFESHGLRGGFFWNAGNLLGFQNEVCKGAGAAAAQPASSAPVQGAAILPRGASLSTITSSFLATTRQSVGFGIRGTVQGARLEFNVAHPLGTQDAPSAGKWPIEFGIGLQWV
jgi:outer membrane protein assembly factor BamA